jgi:hypothetical protein
MDKTTSEAGAQARLGERGSDLVDLRGGRSKPGSKGSTATFNCFILCATKALCLLFGVIGRTGIDCDLVRAAGSSENSDSIEMIVNP